MIAGESAILSERFSIVSRQVIGTVSMARVGCKIKTNLANESLCSVFVQSGKDAHPSFPNPKTELQLNG